MTSTPIPSQAPEQPPLRMSTTRITPVILLLLQCLPPVTPSRP
jgi:hypothetical protein